MTATDKYLNKNDVTRADMLNGFEFGSGPRSADNGGSMLSTPNFVALSGIQPAKQASAMLAPRALLASASQARPISLKFSRFN